MKELQLRISVLSWRSSLDPPIDQFSQLRLSTSEEGRNTARFFSHNIPLSTPVSAQYAAVVINCMSQWTVDYELNCVAVSNLLRSFDCGGVAGHHDDDHRHHHHRFLSDVVRPTLNKPVYNTSKQDI